MAGMDDVYKAFAIFDQGVKNFQTTRALEGANERVHQIREQVTDEAEQMKAMRAVAQDVTMQLTSLGQSPQSIAQVVRSFAGDPEFEQQRELERMRETSLAARDKEKYEFTAKESALDRASAERVAATSANGKKENRPLEIGAINKIQDYDSNLVSGYAIMDRIKGLAVPGGKAKGGIMGLQNVGALGRVRGLVDAEYAGFETEVEQWFNQYRKAVTGASATQGELEQLRKSMPKTSDPPKIFASKLQSVLKIGERVRNRYLQNLKAGKRDVTGFEKAGQAADPTAGLTGGPNASYAPASGGPAPASTPPGAINVRNYLE